MRNLFVLACVLWVCSAGASELTGANAPKDPFAIPDVAGVWTDHPAPTITNAYMIISQIGSKLKMVHHLTWKGQPFIEEGVGTINADGYIQWDVIVTTPIPGWATAGQHKLKYESNKGTLKGTYHDNKDNEGPLFFHRLKAE